MSSLTSGNLICAYCYSSILFYGQIKGRLLWGRISYIHTTLLHMYTGPFPIQCYLPELYTYTTWAFLKHSLEILTQLFCWKKHPMVSTAYHLCVLHMKKVFATYEALYLHARLCISSPNSHISIRKKTTGNEYADQCRTMSPFLWRKSTPLHFFKLFWLRGTWGVPYQKVRTMQDANLV